MLSNQMYNQINHEYHVCDIIHDDDNEEGINNESLVADIKKALAAIIGDILIKILPRDVIEYLSNCE